MPKRDLDLAQQPCAAPCFGDIDRSPSTSYQSLLSVPPKAIGQPIGQRDFLPKTPRASESTTPSNLQVAKAPSAASNGFQGVLDQQRIALLEALTTQHSTLVQFVEKQYQAFRVSSEFQAKRERSIHSSAAERSINCGASSTAERSINCGTFSALTSNYSTWDEDNHGSGAFASLITQARNAEEDGMESHQQGHLTVPKTLSCLSSHGSSAFPSGAASPQTAPSRNFEDDDSPRQPVSVWKTTSCLSSLDPIKEVDTTQFSFAQKTKSSMANVISYLRSTATLTKLDDKAPATKKLGDLKRQATDLHINDTLGSKKNHPESGRTPRLDLLIAVIICLNGITMALNVEWRGYKASKTIGLNQDDDSWPHADTIFTIFEHAFTIIFVLEMGIRIHFQGYRYFYEKANLFDAFLALSAVVDTYLLPLIESDGRGGNLTLLRFVRMFKLARVMRAVRMLSFCSSLRVLVKTIVTGCYSLVWSVVLLGIIICIGGIVVSQLTESVVTDETVSFDRRVWIYHYYGTSLRSMYTLFEVTLSGCWPNYARRLIHEVNGWWALFWIVYILLVVFAILRIISAIFLKDTLDNAKADAEMMINEKMKTKESYLEKLRNAFEAIDTHGKGVVSRAEFDFVLQHPKVSAYLAVLDLEVHESSLLFNLLDEDGIGCITYDEFLDGVMKLKGQARALDVIAIQQDFKGLWKGLNYLNENFERVFGQLDKNNPTTAAAKKLFMRKTQSKLSGSVGMIRGTSNASAMNASTNSAL